MLDLSFNRCAILFTMCSSRSIRLNHVPAALVNAAKVRDWLLCGNPISGIDVKRTDVAKVVTR